jgi:hypothetical protein
MSNDINSLLSTFKTNMMNNGITVESSDKFKSLIDKIATMVEEGSGKGIQFANGDAKTRYATTDDGIFTGYNNYNTSSIIELKLSFDPSFVVFAKSGFIGVYYRNGLLNINNATDLVFHVCTANNDEYSIQNVMTPGGGILRLPTGALSANQVLKWIAIGVGEEDTTLRDSLTSILQEEGVTVTEEDDMASLIAKVDEEFDTNKQELINALIDKGVKNIDTTLSFTEIISKIQNFDSYTEPILYLYDNGNDFTDNTGGFTFTRTSGNGGSGVANEDHLYVHVYANATASTNGSGSAYCETTNFINITNYKSLYVNLDYNYSRSGGSMGTGSFYIDLIDESGNILKTVASGTYNHVGYEGKIDITNYAGNVKIRFRTTVTAITTRSDSKLKVYHARLEKAELPTEE